MSAEVRDVLLNARVLIAKPEQWTRGAWARDSDGWPVIPEARRARSWCADGACLAVTGTTAARQAQAFLSGLAGRHLTAYNDADGTTHADVLALFDRAIEATKP